MNGHESVEHEMNQYNDITTLQYMGSKARIISNICDPIVNRKEIKQVIDLFAGTGSVGYALKGHKAIISNDIEYYSYIINQAILNGCNFSENALKIFLDSTRKRYSSLTVYVKEALDEEKNYFEENENTDYSAYKRFCENTPSVFNPNTSELCFKGIEALVHRVKPGAQAELDVPCLFLTYYANAYFGIDQCCQIDAIRSSIDNIDDKKTQYVLLAALMSFMSSTASTTTHFAQYLKVKSKVTCKNIVEKRKANIIEGFERVLSEYRKVGLCSQHSDKAICFNLDFAECLNTVSLNSETLVYADPPYFKEHYSRYYHVLNTLCLYDYPAMSINPQTHEYSIGRYREDRCVSDFGKKAKALSAFKYLIDKCADSGVWLMLSYSDNSIVDIQDIQKLAECRYDVLIEKIELNHSKQGRSSISKVDEYIFICRPKEIVCDVAEKLSVIKELKPVVDNPAGLMHNYMARKPYNVVSELIKRFCPEDGCVYDPMFGSGTTLIEASKLGRKAIGTDINLLAYKLCRSSLTKWDLYKANVLIDSFCQEIGNACKEIYYFEENGESRTLERCHFDQVDKTLKPVAYWYKAENNGKLSGRKKGEVSSRFIQNYDSYKGYIPKYVTDNTLLPNSRIAIGNSDTVHMYFCNRNLIAIDRIIGVLKNYKADYGYEILELIVSSAVNLIKLSDKKASSQMPYWLPKTNVTSRNAVMIVEQKAKVFKAGLQYLKDNCKCFLDDDKFSRSVVLENVPAQFVSKDVLPDESVDLVLTDPPYTDQVPYLEYSQLWYKVMSWDGFSDELLESELVVSDAPSRKKNIDDFNAVFAEIINRIVPALKTGGYFIMFYHSFDLTSWSYILDLMQSYGLEYCGQMPSATPRKSFKTVMTPQGTLDGNYIVVFQKKEVHKNITFTGTIDEAKDLAIKCAAKIIAERTAVTSQELYDCGMLKDSFELAYLPILSQKYATFLDVIADEFVFEDGLWREKACTGC